MELNGNMSRAVCLALSATKKGCKAALNIEVDDETDGTGVKAKASGNLSGIFIAFHTICYQLTEKCDAGLTIDDVLIAVKIYHELVAGDIKELYGKAIITRSIDGGKADLQL